MQPGILRMFRGDAAQHFPIKRATWGFSQDAGVAKASASDGLAQVWMSR